MKRLLLLLLPAGAGIALWFYMMQKPNSLFIGFILLLLPFLMGFAIQGVALFFSHRWEKKWLRFVSLGLTPIPLAAAVKATVEQNGFLWILGVILFLVMALNYVLGWGAAWGLEKTRHE